MVFSNVNFVSIKKYARIFKLKQTKHQVYKMMIDSSKVLGFTFDVIEKYKESRKMLML